MTLQTLAAAQASAEVPINENFESLDGLAIYGKRHPASTGLTWGYYGGRWGGTAIADGTLALTNTATNYLTVARSTGTISTSTAATAWNDTVTNARVYKLTTAGGVVTATEDHRCGPHGVLGQAVDARCDSVSAAYTFVLADAGGAKLHPAGDTTARTWTIPANASVAYPIGTTLQMINEGAAGVLTISITTDTMRLAGAGTTGSRTLAADGVAWAVKTGTTAWLIYGYGLT